RIVRQNSDGPRRQHSGNATESYPRTKMKIFRFCLLVFLVQIAAAQQPATGVLQGVVVQEGTNTPLGNARVDLRKPGSAATLDSSTTDRDGRFSFIKVPAGVYRLVASR